MKTHMLCPRCEGKRVVDGGACYRCNAEGVVRTAAGDRATAQQATPLTRGDTVRAAYRLVIAPDRDLVIEQDTVGIVKGVTGSLITMEFRSNKGVRCTADVYRHEVQAT